MVVRSRRTGRLNPRVYGSDGAPILAGGPGGAPGDPGKGGDPIDRGTGVLALTKTDLQLPDVLPIGITRTYRSLDTVVRSFGIGVTHEFDLFLVGDSFRWTYAELIMPDGGCVHYARISPGPGGPTAVYEDTSSPTRHVCRSEQAASRCRMAQPG